MTNDDIAKLWHMSRPEQEFGTLAFTMAATALENAVILRNKVYIIQQGLQCLIPLY
jgi:hypothetical protein